MSRIRPTQLHAAIQVFACAARHMSFTRCAEELHVTPGAISQQMRQLEERLGFRLFQRDGRGLALTAEGQRLAQVANEVHGRLDDTLRELRSDGVAGAFRLRSVPSFLSRWLMPRLPDLQQRFPNLRLRIESEDSSTSLASAEFDLAIDLNDGSYPGLLATSLMDESIFPVCAPSLLPGGAPLTDLALQLPQLPLLHDMTAWRGSSDYAEWEYYLAAIGVPAMNVRRGHVFNRNHLVIRAAISGMGIAIARRTLITDELKRGALVVPFGSAVPVMKRYVLLYREGALQQPATRAVHDWIVEQVQQP
jgi:LysR family glycine cleavage system transcriptional activator